MRRGNDASPRQSLLDSQLRYENMLSNISRPQKRADFFEIEEDHSANEEKLEKWWREKGTRWNLKQKSSGNPDKNIMILPSSQSGMDKLQCCRYSYVENIINFPQRGQL